MQKKLGKPKMSVVEEDEYFERDPEMMRTSIPEEFDLATKKDLTK